MFKYSKFICVLACLLIQFSSLPAQLIINELTSNNESNFTDEFGKTPDWIELYNENNFPINLSDFYLSDNENELTKWSFPDISIRPNEYLIIIADSEDILSTYAHTNFKLSKEGESLYLTDRNLDIIDSVSFPSLPENLSYGKTDSLWVIMNSTPGIANLKTGISKLPEPEWSLNSGFYTNTISLELSSSEGADIRYSINNKPEVEFFDEYTGPITINTTANICAYAQREEFIPSSVKCQTFFRSADHNIPVVSIAGNTFDFFDNEEGIFSLGPDADSIWPFWNANFWKDTKLEVHFEYFVNQQSKLSQTVGLKMHGGRESRTSPMKSMRFLADEKYGNAIFEYPVFKQKPNVNSFKKLVLRNASGDYNVAHLRDGFLQSHLISNSLNIDFNAYQAVAVYINGKFYGFMGLREKIDDEYLKSNYKLEKNEIDLLENDTIVLAGEKTKFLEDYTFTQTHDLSVESNYTIAESLFDIESLVDYFIAEISTNNTAWPNNNIRFWREHKETSKWRYLLFDMDVALGRHPWTEAHVNVFENKFESLGDSNLHLNIFYALLKNKGFKNYFLNRHQDIANTVFEFNYFLNELENHVDTIRKDMQQHFEEWDSELGQIWESENIEIIKFYIAQRPDYSKKHLIDAFNLDGSYALDIIVNNKNGYVGLNTLDSLQNFHGYYIKNIPIELNALGSNDSNFAYWKIITQGEQSILFDKKIILNLSDNTKVEAYYDSTKLSKSKLSVNYNENNKELTFKISDAKNLEDMSLLVFDSAGRTLFKNKLSLTQDVWQSINLNIDNSGIYFLSLQNGSDYYSTKFMVTNVF